MQSAIKALGFGLIVLAGAAFAADATDPTVKARQQLMDTIALNTKVLGDMAQGKAAFDTDAAATARSNLAAAAADIPVKFQEQATDPATKAGPQIWTNWDTFLQDAEALTKAAEAMNVSDVEGIAATMGSVGGVCGDCHKAFRSQ